MSKTVLIADDEKDIIEILASEFEDLGFEVYQASSGYEALEIFKKHRPQFVITDVRMPNGDGVELLKGVKKLSPETKVVMTSGYSEYSTEFLIQNGATKFLLKPFDLDELIEFIKSQI